MDYNKKYIKYKKKYIDLKRMLKFKKAIDLITKSPNKSFEFVEIGMNEDQHQAINQIKIIPYNNFDYYGVFKSDTLDRKISDYLTKFGNINVATTVSDMLITNIIKPFLKAMDKNSLWFTIRVMTPTTAFDIPRWHMDGPFWIKTQNDNKCSLMSKLAGVLVGPGTLFKKDNSEMKTKYIDLHKELYKNFDYNNFNSAIDMENRKKISEELNEYESIQPNNNQVAIFTVGNPREQATVHSEPPINTLRLFFSIVAGNKDEIKELTSRWNVEFID